MLIWSLEYVESQTSKLLVLIENYETLHFDCCRLKGVLEAGFAGFVSSWFPPAAHDRERRAGSVTLSTSLIPTGPYQEKRRVKVGTMVNTRGWFR
jgi:hypothetical protein